MDESDQGKCGPISTSVTSTTRKTMIWERSPSRRCVSALTNRSHYESAIGDKVDLLWYATTGSGPFQGKVDEVAITPRPARQ